MNNGRDATVTDVASDGSSPNGAVAPEIVRKLSRIDPLGNLLGLLAEYAAIAGAVVVCEHFGRWWLYVPAVVFIGARYHALGVIFHDAVHYRLLRSHKWNDRVATFAISPILQFFWLRDYRPYHLEHHRHLKTERDPQIISGDTKKLPLSRKDAVGLFARLLGISFFVVTRDFLLHRNRLIRVVVATLLALLVAGLWFRVTAVQLLWLYWIIPLHTWGVFTGGVRDLAEHPYGDPDHPLAQKETRTVLASWWERILVVPKNVHYHSEHHWYPSVPYSRLPELHSLLMKDDEFRRVTHFPTSYYAVFREALRRPARVRV